MRDGTSLVGPLVIPGVMSQLSDAVPVFALPGVDGAGSWLGVSLAPIAAAGGTGSHPRRGRAVVGYWKCRSRLLNAAPQRRQTISHPVLTGGGRPDAKRRFVKPWVI